MIQQTLPISVKFKLCLLSHPLGIARYLYLDHAQILRPCSTAWEYEFTETAEASRKKQRTNEERRIFLVCAFGTYVRRQTYVHPSSIYLKYRTRQPAAFAFCSTTVALQLRKQRVGLFSKVRNKNENAEVNCRTK